MVRGQHLKTKEWSLKGEVLEMVHGDRAVNVKLDEGVTRLFARDAVRKDTTRAYQEQEKEELRCQVAGTVREDRPEADLEQLEESRNKRSERRKLNMDDVEPRRSLRLAKNKVTMGPLGTVDDPKVLPYYMAAIESGYAGTRQNNPRVFSEEEEARTPDIGEQQELIVQEEADKDEEEAMEQAIESMEEL